MKKDYSKIPIKNVYYMLCYAWNILKPEKNKQMMSKVAFNNIFDLLGSMLVVSINKLIKKGLYQEYIDVQEKIGTIKGKINFNEVINSQCLISKKLVCEFDEFSVNNNLNGIIKYTLFVLLKNKELDSTIKEEIKRIYMRFGEISLVKPDKIIRNHILFNRNNNEYILPFNICCLIYDGLIADEEDGKVEFGTFIKDAQMAKVFEKFVLNYYKKTTKKPIVVSSPIIPWNLVEKSDLFPIMRTDVVLENQAKGIQLIIDTKYYAEILRKRNYSEEKKFISGHLYQIYTYVDQSQYKGIKIGMLLYPQNSLEVNDDENVVSDSGQEKRIIVRTINLAGEWTEIESFLDSLLEIIK